MIDIHSHILPGLDDGSPDLATSIRMAEIAVSEGISKMIATPHFIESDLETSKDLIFEKVTELNTELKKRKIDLTILPGQEILITPGIPDLFKEGKLVTLGGKGKYLLLELPMMSIPVYTKEVIHQLHLRGVNVILAHPERNQEIMRNPEKVKAFLRLGVLIQINSLSLIGVSGKKAKEAGLTIINSGMAHFLATDCHTMRARSPRVQESLKYLTKETANLLFVENPAKILSGDEIGSLQLAYEGKGVSFSDRLSLFFNNFI